MAPSSAAPTEGSVSVFQAFDRVQRVPATNALSLSSLPNELLLEIVNCFPSLPTLINGDILHDDKDPTRREVIAAFSQTCRRFRSLFYPLLWRTIEAVAKIGIQWKKRLAADLMRQLDFVMIQNPSFAEHVEILSMIVTDDPYASVKDKFCAGLAMFKNLHTLQIPEVTGPNFIFGEHGSEWFPRTLWRQPPLLSVRTMAIPWQLFDLLSCTPNLERLHIVDWTPRPWQRRMYHAGANQVLYEVPYLKELTSTDRPLDAPWISYWYATEARSLEHLAVKVCAMEYCRCSSYVRRGDVPSSEPTPNQEYLEECVLDIVWELHWLRTLRIVAGLPNDDDTFWKESLLNLIEPLREMIPKRNAEPLEPSRETDHPTAMVRGPPSTSLSLTFVYPSGAQETVEIETLM
ncbi:hypothetical protein GGG16DRAFT_129235 [Schizophyllum commune]